MRIFKENTECYLHALASSLSQDPASFEAWRCLHLTPPEGERLAPLAADALKTSRAPVDCDLIFCTDGDVFLISRELTAAELQVLGQELAASLSGNPEITVYDLFQDWRATHSALLAKAGPDASFPAALRKSDAAFGEVGALLEAFAEAKKLRHARQPQYVMVVDDDPLTRRLVAGAFKEKYALITAADAQEAVANYLLHAPDIVFLDINMPDIGGFAVLRQLLASDPDAYVVMFSGNSYLDNVTEALSGGASGFVAKPFKKEKLRRYIEDSAMHHRKYA